MGVDTRITGRWNQKGSRRDDKWGRASELTKLIRVCRADTGDDSESHGPVWLCLIDETCMQSVCEMSCSLEWTTSEVGGKSALNGD
jgi:hypothetical protein